MGIKLYPKSKQANGNFNFGEILEKKPKEFCVIEKDNDLAEKLTNNFKSKTLRTYKKVLEYKAIFSNKFNC